MKLVLGRKAELEKNLGDSSTESQTHKYTQYFIPTTCQMLSEKAGAQEHVRQHGLCFRGLAGRGAIAQAARIRCDHCLDKGNVCVCVLGPVAEAPKLV